MIEFGRIFFIFFGLFFSIIVINYLYIDHIKNVEEESKYPGNIFIFLVLSACFLLIGLK